MTVQFIPVAPTGITPLGYIMVATDFDDPDTGGIGVISASEYMVMKTFDPRKAFRYEVRVPNLTAGTSDLGVPAVIHSKGFLDFAKPPHEGVVYLSGESFAANSAIGRVILTMVVKLRRKR